MRNITYEAVFYKGDEYLFHSTGFAGYNGIMTGMKEGAFAIAINARKPGATHDIMALIKNLASLFAGYY